MQQYCYKQIHSIQQLLQLLPVRVKITMMIIVNGKRKVLENGPLKAFFQHVHSNPKPSEPQIHIKFQHAQL